MSFVLPLKIVAQRGYSYEYIISWIRLNARASLATMALAATFLIALSGREISCSVVAGYDYDHIFITDKKTNATMHVLSFLAEDNPVSLSQNNDVGIK